MRKFDLSLRSSRSSYFATFRHQLTILSKTDALDEEKWLNMLGTFVKDWFRYESQDRKSGSAGMPRPISYAVFCLKKKKNYQFDPRTCADRRLQVNYSSKLDKTILSFCF